MVHNYVRCNVRRDRVGDLKFHTGSAILSWDSLDTQNRRRIVYNKRTGFGSYEIDALIPNNWLVLMRYGPFTNELHPSDPRYNDF
jgi:hypothetical protein